MLASCNLYGGLDKPDGDEQLLAAARAALDQGDYQKAREYYQRLSSAYSDQKQSELTFTTLAESSIFTITDIVSSIGSDRGSASSFVKMAELLAARGKTDGSIRTTLQAQYAANATIQNASLKAFMQFFVALALFEQTLASSVGPDGVLTASDLVLNVSACRSGGLAGAPSDGDCDPPASTLLINQASPDATSVDVATGWSSSPSLDKVKFSATAAANAAVALGNGSLQGILDAINALNNLPGGGSAATARATRYVLLTTLFP